MSGQEQHPALFAQYQQQVEAYLELKKPYFAGSVPQQGYQVEPLAQGEYNLNFLVTCGGAQAVFRVNIGTQIGREDQILYEYRTLELLKDSGVTPLPYFVDDSRELIDRGILLMEYLPGRPLVYETDAPGAAQVLARVHQVDVAEEEHHLIREEQPLSLIFTECSGLLEQYFQADKADPEITRQLDTILCWADKNKTTETYFQKNPSNCIVNTEINAGNFIVHPEQQTIHLIDWEMPRWGDPSTDLCHFISPLTTLWKTDYRFDEHSQETFLQTYLSHCTDRELILTLPERIQCKMPYVLLRGISWSAMAWVAYQQEYSGIRNKQTWKVLNTYMDADFISSIFSPYLSL